MIWGREATIKEMRAASPLASSVRASSSCRNSQVAVSGSKFTSLERYSRTNSIGVGAPHTAFSSRYAVAMSTINPRCRSTMLGGNGVGRPGCFPPPSAGEHPVHVVPRHLQPCWRALGDLSDAAVHLPRPTVPVPEWLQHRNHQSFKLSCHFNLLCVYVRTHIVGLSTGIHNPRTRFS